MKNRNIFKKSLLKLGIFTSLLIPSVQALSSCSMYDLVVFNWGEYIDQDVLYAFEDTYNVRVKYLTFDSNESMIQKLAGGSYYDVIFPSEYAVEEMALKGYIEPLDSYDYEFKYYKGKETLVPILADAIDNLKNTGTCVKHDGMMVSCTLDEFNQTPGTYKEFKEGFDLLKYSIPYTFGQLGILYNKNLTTIEDLDKYGYNIFKEGRRKDNNKPLNIVVYDAGRDVLSMALLETGHGIQYEEPNSLVDAENWLRDLVKSKGNNFSYMSDEILEAIPNGNFDIAFTYAGDAIYCISQTMEKQKDGSYASPWDFYIPKAKEGMDTRTNIYTDCMVVMKNSKNKELSYQFIDFMSSHDASYLNTEYIGYTTARKDTYEEITSKTETECTHHDVDELKSDPRHEPGLYSDIEAYKLIDVYEDQISDTFYRYDQNFKEKIEKIWYNVVLQGK